MPDAAQGRDDRGPAEGLAAQAVAFAARLEDAVDELFHGIDTETHGRAIMALAPAGQEKMVHTTDLRHRIEHANRNAGPQKGREKSRRIVRNDDFALYNCRGCQCVGHVMGPNTFSSTSRSFATV
ncbi:hypothetical protein AA0522_0218 [Gluconacetobacter liquefaciens NRIC 0522]|nr:hypothetical protein AA0522_0218 [Gluconacetobacter liquefaciens NRIC 0522]